jgi:hypothetical protein
MEYNSNYFGGYYALTQATIAANKFGAVKAWLQWKFLRVTLGNDIGSTYADPLGADPVLRIYTGQDGDGNDLWDATVNPDNITRDEGLLLEGLFGPLNVAAAAGLASAGTRFTNNPLNNSNTFGTTKNSRYRYGGRVGYQIGNFVKVNGSYIIEERMIGEYYDFKANSKEIAAKDARAETYNHQFGLYGSFNLPAGIELTVGYNGVLTSYLTEFYTPAANSGTGAMVDTGYPQVFKNGVNLNARFKAAPLTFRTDNCLSLWEDKNYKQLNSQWPDYGIQMAATAGNYPVINHFVMWNGVGIDYALAEKLNLSLYARNLYSQYNVSGTMPIVGKSEYDLTRDQLSVAVAATYKFSPNLEVFIKVSVENTTTKRSLDLNGQESGFFIDHVNNNATAHPGAPDPVATTDNELKVRIPIGITLKR